MTSINVASPGPPVSESASQLVVRVPASTSNLGAGFDCVGMAVGRSLRVSLRGVAAGDGLVIHRSGTLSNLECDPDDDLIWRGVVAAAVALRKSPPDGLQIDVTSDIPVARGLGSSAAAVVAGVLLANAILRGGLDSASVIDIAASLEGHPDNVAPCTLGGAVLSVRTAGHHYRSVRLPVHAALRFVFVVPDFEVRTSLARAALPAQVDFDTAVTAAARAAALVTGLRTGDPRLLATALDDVLHVPWRRSLVAGYDHVVNAAIATGALGATLSGSGSTIVAVCTAEFADAVLDAAVSAWRLAGIQAAGFVSAALAHGAAVEDGR